MLSINTTSDMTLPTVTLDGDVLHGVTSFEVKYSTKGKGKGVKFKVTIPTPEIVDGAPKFVNKTYTVDSPSEDETEAQTRDRAETLSRIQELSQFWAKNQTTPIKTSEPAAVGV